MSFRYHPCAESHGVVFNHQRVVPLFRRRTLFSIQIADLSRIITRQLVNKFSCQVTSSYPLKFLPLPDTWLHGSSKNSKSSSFSTLITPQTPHQSLPRSAQALSVAKDVPSQKTREQGKVFKEQDITEKLEFDDIQALIVSPPNVPGSSKAAPRDYPTLLEREALALEGSANFSRRERNEATYGLLDLLEQKGVTPGYAFEFVRHAGELIDALIAEAKETLAQCPPDNKSENPKIQEVDSSAQVVSDPQEDGTKTSTTRRLKIPAQVNLTRVSNRVFKTGVFPTEKEPNLVDETVLPLASRVAMCAEQQGLARLVFYFQLISMKAVDIHKLLPFVGRRIDVVMAKVEFLRSICVRYEDLPAILAGWPQLLSYECDSLALVAEYLTSIGLTAKEIGKLVTKHPKILGRNVVKDLHAAMTLLEGLSISLKDAKRLVVRDPTLLTEHAEKKLGPVVEYFEGIGVQRKHIGALLVRRPVLLDSDVEKDLGPIGDYLKSINASMDDIDKIVTSFPWLFCYDLEEDFRPTVLHLETLGVERGLMGKLFRRHPQLLKNRHNFELKTAFLLNLGLEQKDLGKVIYNAPQLLGLSVEENMVPTVKFLCSLGINGPALLKVLKTKPMILAYSVEGKLQPNVKFLESIQVKPEDIGKLVTRHPQLLTLSVEKNLKPTVSYFLELGFTKKDLADMIRRLPSLLGFSVTTVLDPKYRYLVDSMKRSPVELVQFPHFFSYSLTKRLVPRHERLGDLLASLSLGSVYGCSDEVFEKKLVRWMQSAQKLSAVPISRVPQNGLLNKGEQEQ